MQKEDLLVWIQVAASDEGRNLEFEKQFQEHKTNRLSE
jgi:hypothetical protein